MSGRIPQPKRGLLVAGAFLAVVFCAAGQDGSNVLKISDVSVSPEQFNPSNGEKASITYVLSRDAAVKIRIYDPDAGLVAYVVNDKPRPKGLNKETWDGRDERGVVVPDEAYYFTIDVRSRTFRTRYDPTETSGGEEIDLESANFDKEAGIINYVLKKPARIQARAGIENGPLMMTLEDWVPRPRGGNTIYWNGLDDTGKIDVMAQPNFKMTIGGFELPENSLITYGNARPDYWAYRETNKPSETKTMEPLQRTGQALSRHYFMTRIRDRSPRVLISLPSAGPGALPVLRGRLIVQVDIGPQNKKYFTMEQFEIVFAVDGRYFVEETNGYVPYNWSWDTTQFPDGEHILTVNVASLNDQIGASSKMVLIKNKAQ